MRILHVVPTYVPAYRHGGPVRAVHGLAKALAERGHEVSVFTTDVHAGGRLDVPLGTPVDRDGVRTRYFPVRFPRRLYYAPGMRAALRDIGDFDVAHLHSCFLWPTLAAARAAGKASVPYLVAPRGMLVPELLAERGRYRKRLWIRLFERRTLAAAAGLHATAPLEVEDARRLFATGTGLALPAVFVVPNGVDVAAGTAEPPGACSPAVAALLARGPFVLYLGRISWKKGLDRLIRAMAAAPGATLALAGNDEEGLRPKLERIAAEAGVAERVAFLGPVDGADKAALLGNAALLALPSASENFGNAALEAMAAGRPVVVTPGVGLAAVVEEARCGRVVPGDPEPLGRAIAELLADPAAADEMGARGQAVARDRFSWPAIAARMEEVYHAIASAPRRPR